MTAPLDDRTVHHIISVLVEDKPGVLARVSSMFARRGFNIHSLAVGPSAEPGMSKMTVVVDGPEMEQIVKQLRKMVNTVKVTELNPGDYVETEVALIRVSTDPKTRGELLDAASIFQATVADVGMTSLTFEVSGNPDKIADFLDLLRPYGLVDIVKSGRIALSKDARARNLRPVS